jgi:hypothetical protein
MWWNSRNVRSLHLPSGGGHEGALATVAPPDLALDFARDMAGGSYFPIRPGTDRRVWIRLRMDRPVWPGLVCRPELPLLDLLEQHREGAVEDRTRIAVGDLAAEKGLQPPQLLVGLLADGELHAVALGRPGLDDRARGGRQR